jgi:hypothetical protein
MVRIILFFELFLLFFVLFYSPNNKHAKQKTKRSDYADDGIEEDEIDNEAQDAAFLNAMSNEFFYSQVIVESH